MSDNLCDILPGVTAPDPDTCLWCGRKLAVLHYHFDPPYDGIIGYADKYDCHCVNPDCDAYMATGDVRHYPDTASVIVAAKKRERGSNLEHIERAMADWLPVLATTRDHVDTEGQGDHV